MNPEYEKVKARARLTDTRIGDLLDLEKEFTYLCSDGSKTTTIDCREVVEAQIDKLLRDPSICIKDPDRPKIICLCGSSRFIWYFAVMAWEFEKLGAITLGLHLLPQNYTTEKIQDHIAEWEGVAEKMDALHRKKIDLADEVFIINVGGYIGNSTRHEIEYAQKTGKPIKYLEPTG